MTKDVFSEFLDQVFDFRERDPLPDDDGTGFLLRAQNLPP